MLDEVYRGSWLEIGACAILILVPGNFAMPLAIGHQPEQSASPATLTVAGSSTLEDAAVDDGPEHLRHATNRRFSSRSLLATPGAQEGLECYRGRVAYALEINRVRKILSFSAHVLHPEMPSKSGHRTNWNGNEWQDSKHCRMLDVEATPNP